MFGFQERILENLVSRQSRSELANDLAEAVLSKGIALRRRGQPPEALAAFDRVIDIREDLVSRQGRGELANDSPPPC